MKLADLGEFGFIDRIGRTAASGRLVRQGIGDDCAVLEMPPGHLLLTTTDMLVEEVHFRRQWTDFRLLGRKSAAVNLSDIAAMGGIPRFLYLGLALSPELSLEDLDAFTAGFIEKASEHGASLAGGDTCRSPGPLVISVTAEGTVPEGEVVKRSGSAPGDAIYVSGTLGDSALALRQLLAGKTPEPSLARRHHDPEARVDLGRALAAAGIPSAMIDVSDGLVGDLGHILKASGTGAVLELGALPLSAPLRKALAETPEVLELALTGGEDYELLFTVPSSREALLPALVEATRLPLTRVGTITSEKRLAAKDPEGREYRLTQAAYDHFRRRETS
jgi:thiamine-monophosphate kinase